MNLAFKIHELIRFFEDLITWKGESLLKEILFVEHCPRPTHSALTRMALLVTAGTQWTLLDSFID